MKPIIFCDFDGTITNTDNIIAIMKKFAPEGWDTLKDQVLKKEISISQGVGEMFSLLKSDLKQEIIDFVVKEAGIRTGFQEFVQFTKENQIPFNVVSGGMDFFVEPLLKDLIDKDSIYCNSASFDDEYILIEWPNECDELCSMGCGCCKPTVMRKKAEHDHFTVVIGDSITDLEAAKQANLVIARDFLVEKCNEEGIPYKPFETFYDCINILQNELEVRV